MNIMSKTNPIRRLLTTVSLFVMLILPLSAQELTDSVFTFRFLTGKDMFYSPGLNNGKELTRLFNCVDRYRDLISSHKIFLYVEGYSLASGNRARNLSIARIRSNRVKSELITRKDLKEDNFITRNHAGEGKKLRDATLSSR